MEQDEIPGKIGGNNQCQCGYKAEKQSRSYAHGGRKYLDQLCAGNSHENQHKGTENQADPADEDGL